MVYYYAFRSVKHIYIIVDEAFLLSGENRYWIFIYIKSIEGKKTTINYNRSVFKMYII